MLKKNKFVLSTILSIGMIGSLSTLNLTAHASSLVMEMPASEWLSQFKAKAYKEGIDKDVLDNAFKEWKPIDKVLYYDQRQPEFSRTFWGYMNSAISNDRIARGQMLLKKHAKLLKEVERKFGVQPRFLVAFWGLESNFGDYTGGFPVVGALATLAHDTRRRDFFTKELMLALKILNQGHISFDKMLGSWAGAMGQTQFMPSTFTGYAFDGDSDGRKDLWGSLPDVMYSSSNYLSTIGWKGDETWGREVKLPENFDWEIADLKVKKTLKEWQAIGIRKVNGNNLPNVEGMLASVVLPAGHKGPAFLVYNNFRKIMVWNRSILYAIAVGHLADRLKGKSGLSINKPANDKPLHRDQMIALQDALNNLGFDAGKADGILGSKTRAALKLYQIKHGLPADGYPETGLVETIIELPKS